MPRTYGVGIIGAGNISTAYLKLAPLFNNLRVVSVADMMPTVAQARAQEFGVAAETPDQLLKNSEIDVVVNLTVPAAHYKVTSDIISAGKHAYSEKPFVLSVDEGKAIKSAAETKGLKVGSAPDTFLGGAHQLARSIVDSGRVGRIASGTMHIMGRGMEHWHPNPTFFFELGGGPILDMGPYYITNLVNLAGPVKRVTAFSGMARTERVVSTPGSPILGQAVPVKTPTTIHAVLELHNGALVTLGASWDVYGHRHHNIELYGTEGSLYIPDPNFFSGDVVTTDLDGAETPEPAWDHPLGVANWDRPNGPPFANYRNAGLSDMMASIDEGRAARCSIDVALHVIDVMTAILKSGETGQVVTLSTTCERPAALSPDQARALLR